MWAVGPAGHYLLPGCVKLVVVVVVDGWIIDGVMLGLLQQICNMSDM